MVGQHAGNPPSTHLPGTWEHLLLPCSATNRPAPGPGPAPLVGQAASAAPQPGRLRSSAKSGVDPRASHARPPFDHLARQARFGQRRPSRSPTTATRRTRCANRGRSRRTDVFRIQRGCSGRGHRTRVRPDTRSCGHQAHGHRTHGHRTRGHRTSTRPVGRTSVRTADSGRGHSDERRGRPPDILDGHHDGDRRPDGATLARVDDRKIFGGHT